ncbi:MAG: DUF5107 domain-containing protein [Verrucomicrobia bacterium]|nr:DUF5107 domain-containing protein [Verrucomicrobiota bacterium]
MNTKPAIEFAHNGIEVSQTTLVIPTYCGGPADPNPSLFGKGIRAIYPYEWRKSFTREIVDRTYDALVLRSPWMELTFLPDWGFHLYRAVDRVTGRDLFHRPAVMKPAHNAIRGAYVAGGVEFNFPIGHNAMTWNRIGLNIRKTDEGVTVLFQDVERRSGMHWAAGVTLTAGMRGVLFDQFLYNATPLPQPWYFWLNAGLVAHSSLRFIFPTDRMLGHFEGSFLETLGWYSFPIHQGHDYGRYADIPEPIGLFSPTNAAGWFGVWYDDWDFGVARWAAPWQVGGQKLWSWGTSEEGCLWGQIAADQELPVPEIQSGRPETQMDRQILRPYETVAHREWWFPASGIGGLQAASRFVAVHAIPRDGQTLLKCSTVQAVPGCHINVNGQRLPAEMDLAPGRVQEVAIPLPCQELMRIQVRTPRGAVLEWDRNSAPLAITLETIADSLEPLVGASAESWYLRGARAQRMLRPDLALRFYQISRAPDNAHRLFLQCVAVRLKRDASSASRQPSVNDTICQLSKKLDRALGVSLMARFERRWAGLAEETLRIPSDQETEDYLRLAAAVQYTALGQSREKEALWHEVQSPGVKASKGCWGHSTEVSPDPSLYWAWGETDRQGLVSWLERHPDDGAAHFSLGCLLAESGQLELAVTHLREAARRRPDDSVVRTTLGRVCLEWQKPAEALRELEVAVAGNPTNAAAWVWLDQALGFMDARNAEWLRRVRMAPSSVQSTDDFCEMHARLATDLQLYDEAAEILAGHWFHPYELTHQLRSLWVRIHRRKAITLARDGDFEEAQRKIEIALTYPENLQLGRPRRTFDAPTLYTAGRIMELAAKADTARAYYQRAAEEDHPGPTPAKPWGALATWELGNPDQARIRLIALEDEANRCLAAVFQPDLESQLQLVADLSRRFREHSRPNFDELRKIL